MKDIGWQENFFLFCWEFFGQFDFFFVCNLMDFFEVGKYEGNMVSIVDYFLFYFSWGEVMLILECMDEEFVCIEIKSLFYFNVFQCFIIIELEFGELEQIIQQKANDFVRG